MLRVVRLSEKSSNEVADIIRHIEVEMIKELAKKYKPTLGRRLRFAYIVASKGVPTLGRVIGKELYAIYQDPKDRYIMASAICRSFTIEVMVSAFGIMPSMVAEFIARMDDLITAYYYQIAVDQGLINPPKDSDHHTL